MYILGVVIPTTPNTSSFNFGNSEESLASTAPTIYQPVAATRHLETNSNILSGFGPISMQRIPDGAPQPSLNPQNNPANLNLVERINQIKEYIKITTNLVNSIQDDNKVMIEEIIYKLNYIYLKYWNRHNYCDKYFLKIEPRDTQRRFRVF